MGDNNNNNEEQESNASSALRQKLMTADEVYVYKIPPLKNAGGHRAEDWNLSKPLKTCHMLVERRGDTLVIEFNSADDGALFCQSQIDLITNPEQKMEQWLEQVVDSSRYFVIKIQGAGGREALVGFGFRDRDQATDLRESLQHYERSVRRECQANKHEVVGDGFKIPTLAEGEKIHVNRSGKSTITKKKDDKSKSGGAVPLLKKKPPSSPPSEPKEKISIPKQQEQPKRGGNGGGTAKGVAQLSFSLEGVDLDADIRKAHSGGGHHHGDGGGDDDGDGDDGGDSDGGSSGGAVYTGGEDQWATEFAMK